MKIKEITNENTAPVTSGRVLAVNPSTNTVKVSDTTGKQFEVPKDQFTVNPNTSSGSEVIAQVPGTDMLKPGDQIGLQPLDPNKQQAISEVNSDLDNLDELSDNELVDLAREYGIDDSVDIDEQGILVNRSEIIELLTNGADIGGDATDDFINDVEDPNFVQEIARIQHLSGI